jgi:hypothetical protein
MHFQPARPQHYIPVLRKSGLTNFSGPTVLAIPLASKEKFSAGGFCFFLAAKRKSPSAASRGKTVRMDNVTNIDFYTINYPSG